MKKTLNSEIIFYISDLHPALSFSYKLVFKSAYSGSEYLEEIFFILSAVWMSVSIERDLSIRQKKMEINY